VTRRPRPILLLATIGGLSAVGAFAFDMYLPAFPAIAAEFGVPPGQVQVTLIVALVGLGVGQLVGGPVSDRYGRKGPVLIGLGVYIATSALIALAPTIAVFTALRFLQGVGGGIALTISRAAVRDMFRGAEASRYMSRVTLFFGVAPIVAPNVGAAVLAFTSWRGIFFILAGYGILLVGATLRWLPETLPLERRRSGGARDTAAVFRLLVTDRHFLGYALAQNLTFAGLFAYLSAGSFVLQVVFGVSARTYALIFAANAIGMVIAGQVSAHFVGRRTPRALLFGALVVATLACAVLIAATEAGSLPAVLAALFTFVASLGFVFPNSMALALDKHHAQAGSAAALLGGMQSGVSMIAGPLVAVLGTATGVPMATVMFGSVLLSLVVATALTRERVTPEPALSPD
jgi:DHA1 family bicyclomycin/chloramphenicol resistance-like MFS transporter